MNIRLMKKEDASGVVKLFKAFYGDGYPIKTFYDKDKLIVKRDTKEIVPVICVDDSSGVIGFVALYISSPYKKLYEIGALLVHPKFQRKRYEKTSIGFAISNEACKIAENIAQGIFVESVCNHIHSQKFAYWMGFYECAFEANLMPASAYDKSGAAKGRVSTILYFSREKNSSQIIFIPKIYKRQLEFIYKPFVGLRNFRDILEIKYPESRNKTTAIKQFFDFANTSRVTIENIGDDFSNFVDDIEKDTNKKSVIVSQYWLPLDTSLVEFAIQILKQKDYFFGGVLPLWNRTDALLMQKIKGEIVWEDQQIYTQRAKAIVEMVKDDSNK